MPEVTALLYDERLHDLNRFGHYDRRLHRGWMHLVCFEAAPVVGTLLIVTAHGTRETTIAAVYHECLSPLRQRRRRVPVRGHRMLPVLSMTPQTPNGARAAA